MIVFHQMEHLTAWSLARSISAGSRLVMGGVGYAVSFLPNCLKSFLTEETD
jgi:hypothetical protein